MDSTLLFSKLVLPLARLILVMSLGLLVATLLESLHWTRFMTRLASPLVRMGHLRDIAGASFSMAFFSPAAANALLAESYERGELSKRELVLANLFNSSPTFLVHLPSLFSLVFAFLGTDAFVYVALIFLATAMRTLTTMIAGRLFLPPLPEGCVACYIQEQESKNWREVVKKTIKKLQKRLIKLIRFTIPIYCAIFFMQQAGWFTVAENFMAEHAGFLSFLKPESISIIVLYLMAESGAALTAAASLATAGTLSSPEIILSLLIGTIASAPMRAFRHQFPSYAGFFTPALAAQLVAYNQLCRFCSLAIITFGYYMYAF